MVELVAAEVEVEVAAEVEVEVVDADEVVETDAVVLLEEEESVLVWVQRRKVGGMSSSPLHAAWRSMRALSPRGCGRRCATAPRARSAPRTTC